jgi:hypothetical protein
VVSSGQQKSSVAAPFSSSWQVWLVGQQAPESLQARALEPQQKSLLGLPSAPEKQVSAALQQVPLSAQNEAVVGQQVSLPGSPSAPCRQVSAPQQAPESAQWPASVQHESLPGLPSASA